MGLFDYGVNVRQDDNILYDEHIEIEGIGTLHAVLDARSYANQTSVVLESLQIALGVPDPHEIQRHTILNFEESLHFYILELYGAVNENLKKQMKRGEMAEDIAKRLPSREERERYENKAVRSAQNYIRKQIAKLRPAAHIIALLNNSFEYETSKNGTLTVKLKDCTTPSIFDDEKAYEKELQEHESMSWPRPYYGSVHSHPTLQKAALVREVAKADPDAFARLLEVISNIIHDKMYLALSEASLEGEAGSRIDPETGFHKG